MGYRGVCSRFDLECYVTKVERFAAPIIVAGATLTIGATGITAYVAFTAGLCAVIVIPLGGATVAGTYASYKLAKATYR